MIDQARQGDILFIKIDHVPENLLQVKSGVIAEGEITGHMHRLKKRVGTLFKATKNESENHNIIGYVQTPKGMVSEIIHDEHKSVKLDKDSTYLVKQQREHVPSDNLDRFVAPPKVHRVQD